MFKADQKIVVVTRQTRLQGLKAKYATLGHAKFAVAGAMVKELAREAEVLGEEISIDRLRDSAEREFHEYEEEHELYDDAVSHLRRDLTDLGPKVQIIERAYLPEKTKRTEMIEGKPSEAAAKLVEKLKFDARVI